MSTRTVGQQSIRVEAIILTDGESTERYSMLAEVFNSYLEEFGPEGYDADSFMDWVLTWLLEKERQQHPRIAARRRYGAHGSRAWYAAKVRSLDNMIASARKGKKR